MMASEEFNALSELRAKVHKKLDIMIYKAI